MNKHSSQQEPHAPRQAKDDRYAGRLSLDEQELVAFQVAKRALWFLSIPFVITASVAGIFGWNLKTEIGEFRRQYADFLEATKDSGTLLTELRNLKSDLESRRDSWMTQRSALDATSAQITAKMESIDMSWRDSVSKETEVGIRLNQLQRLGNRVEEQQRDFNQRTEAFRENLFTRLQSELKDDFDKLRASLEGDIAAFQKNMRKSFDNEVTVVKADFKRTAEKLDELDRRFQNTGTFAVRERDGAMAVERFGIAVSVGTVHGGRKQLADVRISDLRGNEIKYVRYVQVAGSQGGAEIPVIRFDHSKFSYEVYPNYVIEHWPGPDYAVFDLVRRPRGDEGGAKPATHF